MPGQIIEFGSNHEEEAIMDCFNTLADKDADVEDKFMAIDFLSYFVEEADHREKLGWFYENELDYSVRRMLKKVLDGEYKQIKVEDYDLGVDTSKVDKLINEAATASKEENTNETNKMYQYRRYDAITKSQKR